MEKERFSEEEALDEAEKMRELVGDKGEPEDYDSVQELLELHKSDTEVTESLQKGRVTLEPPVSGHTWMVAFDAKNEKEFDIFNKAAREVTKEYGGFWQHGFDSEKGYSAWELWKWPKDRAPIEILNKIQERMSELSLNSN